MNDQEFSELTKIKLPKVIKILPRIILTTIVLIIAILIFTPWQQTSRGFGYVIAVDPNNRAQNINATVSGRIDKWFVRDGQYVKMGEKLVEIIDTDPLILQRIKNQKDAASRKYEVAKIAAETSKINYARQEELFKQGLSSRKEFESAKIEYKKLLSSMETALSELSESEVRYSRQESQIITAPKDGTILRLLSGNNSTIVKAGDKIASFAPILEDPAIELFVKGNDIGLIYEGRKVRIQFEGWPAIQFSGWPSIAIGTFKGVVSSVDASASENNLFRVIIKKDSDENWPDSRFVRHHTKVYGWVLMNKVSLIYEIWRQINNFPPTFDEERMNEKKEKNHK